MKKHFSFIFFILFCFLLLPSAAHAEEYFTEGLYRCSLKDGQITIVNTDASIAGLVEIPSVLSGRPVTAIGEKAFFGRENITGIVIPESITEIGPYAFCGCINMKEAVLPKGLSVLPMGVFSGCGFIELPSLSGITTISEYAFDVCHNLRTVHIPENVSRIENGAFRGTASVLQFSVSDANPCFTAIDGNLYTKDGKTMLQYALGKPDSAFSFPETASTIAPRAFYWSKLETVEISSHVENIGFEAFYGNEALTRVTLANGVLSVGDNAFAKCESLTDIKIPGSIYSIGADAFRECYALNRVRIENGVFKIEDSAFFECRALAEITLPASLTHIGEHAFGMCDSLVSVRLPETLKSIGSYAFSQCNALETLSLPGSIVSVPKSLAEGAHSLHTVILGHGIEEIQDGAFRSCGALRTVSMPNTVTFVGENAFDRDWEIREVYFQGTPEAYNAVQVAAGNELLKNTYAQTFFLPQIYAADYADNALTVRIEPTVGFLQIKAYDASFQLIYTAFVLTNAETDTYVLPMHDGWNYVNVRLLPHLQTPVPAKIIMRLL